MRLGSFLLFFLLFLFVPHFVFAHSGGGPPFLKVNEKYAQTNPYAGSIITLNIPQDIPPETYLVNKPITVSVDMDRLTKQTTIPPDLVDGLKFRWSLLDGDNFDKQIGGYQFGKEITYHLKTPKSYLLKLEIKSTEDDDFITFDTVQLNVVPNASYQLPKVSVFIGVQKDDTSKPILFVSQAKADPKSSIQKYIWDASDGKLENGSSLQHTFDPLSAYDTREIYHRVIDSKGFVTDTGFVGEIIQGKITFVPFGTMKKGSFIQGTYSEAERLAHRSGKSISGNWGIVLWVVGQLIGLSVMALLFAKYRKIKKKK